MSSILSEYGGLFLKKFLKFSIADKSAVGLIYINRQTELVSLFDERYGTKMHEIFCNKIQECIKILEKKPSGSTDINKDADLLYSIIPDADDYSGIECSYVQNAFLSLYYLFGYIIKNDDCTLQQSLDMALENIDVINYARNPNYDEESVFSNEVQILNTLLEKVEEKATSIFDMLHKESKIIVL